jgi:hypothetical protein
MFSSCAASLKLPQRAAASNRRKPFSGGISPIAKVIGIHGFYSWFSSQPE